MLKQLLLILSLTGLAFFSLSLRAEEMAPSPPSTLSYFPVLPQNAPPDATPQLVPIANNHQLGGAHPGLTRAIIAIHDSSRNARGMLTMLSTLAGPDNDKVLLLAPQFLIAADVDRFYEDVPEILRRNFIVWPASPGEYYANDWESGGNSYATAPQRPISSFTVLDLILMYLGQKQAFPDLKQIIIAGHGAGADFAQRYAALGAAPPILEKQGLAVHFLVANASSYLYFTPARPRNDSVGFGPASDQHCSFNNYKYGLEKLNTYGSHIGANAIKLNYSDRRVTYLLGEEVVTNDPFPDNNCEAINEGPNRYARGLSYNLYLYELFSDAITEKQKSITIPKIGYDPVAMFNSPCGMSVLFGDGVCKAPSQAPAVIQ